MFVLLFRSKNKRSARIDDLIWNCFFPKPVNYSWFVFLYWSEKTVYFFIWLFRHIRGHKVFIDDLVSSYLFTFVFSDAHFSVSKTGFSSRWSAPRVVFRIWCSCFTNKNKNDPVKTKNKEEKEIITLKVNSWKMKQVLEVILGKLHSSQIVCPAESFFSPVTSQTEERKSFRSPLGLLWVRLQIGSDPSHLGPTPLHVLMFSHYRRRVVVSRSRCLSLVFYHINIFFQAQSTLCNFVHFA